MSHRHICMVYSWTSNGFNLFGLPGVLNQIQENVLTNTSYNRFWIDVSSTYMYGIFLDVSILFTWCVKLKSRKRFEKYVLPSFMDSHLISIFNWWSIKYMYAWFYVINGYLYSNYHIYNIIQLVYGVKINYGTQVPFPLLLTWSSYRCLIDVYVWYIPGRLSLVYLRSKMKF